MPLVTYDDLMAASLLDGDESVLERVAERIHDPQSPMPPGGMPASAVATLDAWLEAGAPGSGEACGGPGGSETYEDPTEFTWPEDCEEFFTLTVGSALGESGPHVVGANSEEHPQFIFDAPWGDDDVQILAHRPVVDNERVLHHWILYENSGGLFGFGGKFLVGWAPGGEGSRGMPEGVGMYAPGGAGSLRLDMHYYNLGGSDSQPDDSGVEVCITRSPRPSTATVIGLFGNATAPPGRSDNATSCTANVTAGETVRFLSVSPHMHQLGVHAKLELTRAGQTVSLHDAPFAFEDQRIYPLDGVEIQSGDVLTTTCSYANTTGRTVRFGQNSDDEMCFNFVTYYPMDALRCGLAL